MKKGHKHSEETRKKMSEAHKGKVGFWKGKTGFWKNKRHTKEYKENMSMLAKEKGFGKWMKGRQSSKKSNDKRSATLKGIYIGVKSSAWKGGKSFELYGKEFNKKLKEKIRKRDNYTCQECNYTEKQLGYKLPIHHIDYNKKNNNFSNLITLCRSCHSKTNFQREDWINYFRTNII